jgi:hypothetical protein
MPALAATPAEEAMFQAPMPHQLLGGHGTKVHLVRLHGYQYATHGNAAYLMQLKADMHRCADTMHQLAAPAPSAWPDFIYSVRTDTYASVNRFIAYSRAVFYRMDPRNCGLHEFVSSTALLTSSNGRCDIDLVEKTAHGACDARAHADARVPVRRNRNTTAQANAVLEQLAQRSDSVRAAYYRKMKKAGLKKTILGLQCEVSDNLLDPGGTMCLSLGGSFAGAHVAHTSDHSGLMLEMTSEVATTQNAVQALLDADVDGAVFAPYLSGGYQIRDVGVRK